MHTWTDQCRGRGGTGLLRAERVAGQASTIFRETPAADRRHRPAREGRRAFLRTDLFDSGYSPGAVEPGGERWLGYTANNREYALMLRHKEDRPWLVCVHGAEMGRAAFDLALFRAWHLHTDLGLNVVLPVLQRPGPRGRGLPKGAVFPGEDVMDNVHATAQAVWDIRRLLSWIRSQQPESPIGMYSISLGGMSRPTARAGRSPVGTLGQTRNRLVSRRSHRILPVASCAAIHRCGAGAIRAAGWFTDDSRVQSTRVGRALRRIGSIRLKRRPVCPEDRSQLAEGPNPLSARHHITPHSKDGAV